VVDGTATAGIILCHMRGDAAPAELAHQLRVS
jgi:hypothetical protein